MSEEDGGVDSNVRDRKALKEEAPWPEPQEATGVPALVCTPALACTCWRRAQELVSSQARACS